MRRFFKKILFFTLPVLLLSVILLYSDFFKVFRSYESYTEDTFVGLNREFVCMKTFEKNANKNLISNSFIFGSSRSQAFKCRDWDKYLSTEDVSFHFDANAEGVIGVLKKLQYLKNKTVIKNALLIVDMEFLCQTNLKERENSHLTVSHPNISNSSFISFYKPFIKTSFTPKFAFSYYDFSIFGKYRQYMRGMISESKYPWIVDSINCDINYGIELEIKEDSVGYYNKMKKLNVFSESRKRKQKVDTLSDLTFEILKEISKIFEENKTDFNIIISPLYNQVPFKKEYLKKMEQIFKKSNVYDFSGVNYITSSFGNYYEQSHYRPHVARLILKELNN